jgi:hypothetical protein|nr:MAG TPA: hypothetical protein [Caudoviricetes sp.]
MALDKDSLTTEMINATKSCPAGGADAMKALGKAIEDYLVANTDAQYSWAATNTVLPFEPDSQVMFKAVLSASGSQFSYVPKDFDDFISHLADWLNGIKIDPASGWTLGSLQSGAGSFSADMLMKLKDEKDVDSAMRDSFGKIAEGILAGWQSYFLPSASGVRATYSGSAALVSVS